jgi:hypothetical protein
LNDLQGLVIVNKSVILSEVPTQSKDPLSLNGSTSPGKEFPSRFLSSFALGGCGRAMAAILLLASMASAQTLTGTVKNSTTGKPAAGDEVVLLKLGQGMEEAGRTKADDKGQFSFKLDNPQSPHLVRAIHQDVTYHRMAPPGTTSVEVEVYDVGKKIEDVAVVADIMRVQVVGPGQLEVVREFGVQNTSKPPRTQMNERNLEFYIPDGAHIIEESASATTENGNPLKSAPVPEGEKNRYSFIFPLRPGLTRFEVAYDLPYTGSANLDAKSLYPLEHFVVMIPKSMQFAAASASAGFKLIDYPNEPDASVQVASNTTIGQNLAFKVSGEGTLEVPQEGGAQQSSEGGQNSGSPGPAGSPQANSRPGGGLGPPIDAPDPLQQYRWWILGGIAAALLVGGVYVAVRQQSAARSLSRQRTGSSASAGTEEEDDYEAAEILVTSNGRPASPGRPTSMLLEGLKEELFQLEVERRQGQISQAEYDKAKSALDQTLERALKREAQKA